MRTSVTKIRLAGAGLLVVVVIAIYLAFTAINGVPVYPYKTVSATFATASNVVAHDDVRIDGARIGQVSSTHFDPQTNLTTVKMQLQQGHTVYKDATASIGDVSALGSEYIELDPGNASSGALPQDTIALNHTTTPVEIDAVLSIFGPTQANAAAAAVQTLGLGFSGQQQNIQTLLSSAPKLLPNLGVTTQTLTQPEAGLIPLIRQADLLTSRFQGRQAQLAQLLANMNTTFAALDTQNGQALENTINDAAPVLPQLTPALNDLGQAAGNTSTAVDVLKPGLAALGQATPDLRSALIAGVQPLSKVPGVSAEAVPAFRNLTTTFSTIQTSEPIVPFLSQLMNQSLPLLSYLQPYTGDMVTLWNTLQNGLSRGDAFGNWLPFTTTVDGRSFTAGAATSAGGLVGHCAYPKPGKATGLTTSNEGSC